jgi:hypothetical protein
MAAAQSLSLQARIDEARLRFRPDAGDAVRKYLSGLAGCCGRCGQDLRRLALSPGIGRGAGNLRRE